MNLYLNYAREHLVEPGENDPVGIILCSEKSDTVVRYAMGGINAKVFASQYLTSLPAEDELRREIERSRREIAPAASRKRRELIEMLDGKTRTNPPVGEQVRSSQCRDGVAIISLTALEPETSVFSRAGEVFLVPHNTAIHPPSGTENDAPR